MLPSAHSYENTFNMRFFWGAGQKLRKPLTSKGLRIFVYDPTISCRKSKQQVERHAWIQWNPDFSNPRFPEPAADISNLVSIEFASLKLYNFTPDFSKLPITRITFGSRGRNHLVRMSITFTPLGGSIYYFSKVWISHVHKNCFPLANVGKSHSTRLKVNNNTKCHYISKALSQP